ncbi:MAG: hypothetical protein BWZ08_02689 [candidate division BRC1 bacterium ADurb.BinA292]|nr:MAG: hypothetical protein BWZ08_02689 [candidate division BRC1 bacterium ADurb.BinA292]
MFPAAGKLGFARHVELADPGEQQREGMLDHRRRLDAAGVGQHDFAVAELGTLHQAVNADGHRLKPAQPCGARPPGVGQVAIDDLNPLDQIGIGLDVGRGDQVDAWVQRAQPGRSFL